MNPRRTILLVALLFGLTGCGRHGGGENMVLLPVKDDPTVSFRVLFRVGSQNDPEGKEGLAALTAALIAEGSTKKHSYEEILDLLYPTNIDLCIPRSGQSLSI